MDNDAEILKQMGTALTELQIKYRACNLADRLELRPQLDKLLKEYSQYQTKLLDEGILSTDEDLHQMQQLKQAIDAAAKRQELAAAMVKTAVFIAAKLA